MRCLNVSNYIRKHLAKKDRYEVGDTLICRVKKPEDIQRFNVSYRYRIFEYGVARRHPRECYIKGAFHY